MKNKKLVLTTIATAILLLSAITVTYAFFTANSTTSVSSNASITTGSLTLTLDDAANKGLTTGGAITPTNLSYMTYLSIRNDSPIDVYARILFRGLTNTYSEYLVYSLEEVNSNKASLSPTKVIKDKVRVPASASASNQELANYLKVTAGQTQYYKVTIEYLYSQTVDQSSDLNKAFYTGFTIEEGIEPVRIISKAGSNLATGDKIAIGDENFWVISNTSGTVRALAEYNINVGYYKNTSVPEGLQHSTVRGWLTSGTKYGTVAFGGESRYSTSWVKSLIDDYVALLNSTYGTNITGNAITSEELQSPLGCIINYPSFTCSGSSYQWVTATSYWTSVGSGNLNVRGVGSDGSFNEHLCMDENRFGVRPVIIISESAF